MLRLDQCLQEGSSRATKSTLRRRPSLPSSPYTFSDSAIYSSIGSGSVVEHPSLTRESSSGSQSVIVLSRDCIKRPWSIGKEFKKGLGPPWSIGHFATEGSVFVTPYGHNALAASPPPKKISASESLQIAREQLILSSTFLRLLYHACSALKSHSLAVYERFKNHTG